jgi:hypothetical protein
MSTSRRADLTRLAALAARRIGQRMTHPSAADLAHKVLFVLAETADVARFRALRGEA